MHQTLIPGLPIQSFGLAIAVGVLVAWKVLEKISGGRDFSNLILLLVASGIAGARLAHVIEYWSADGFAQDPVSALYVWRGGLVFYGGFIAAAAAFAAWCAATRSHPLDVADLVCVILPLAHAFGRVGCFLNGCCWGKVSSSPLAVTFPAGSPVWFAHPGPGARSLAVIPAQLVEAAALLALFAALLALYRRKKAFTAAAYLAGYGTIRFLVEFLRDDERPSAMGFSSAQIVSAVLVAAGAAFFAWSLKRSADGRSASDNGRG